MRIPFLFITLLITSLTSGCAYKPDVQQGNSFDDKAISQLKVGMTQQQVVFIMGTALLKDPFHQNRWDYIYSIAKGRAKAERRLITLYFENEVLSKIDDSQVEKITLN